MAQLGVVRVNGTVVRNPEFRFQPGDYFEFLWAKVQKFSAYFKQSTFRRRFPRLAFKPLTHLMPGNIAYYPQLRAGHYLRLPRAQDLRENGRLAARLFR